MLVALDSNIFIAALSSKEKHSLNAQKLLRDISSRKNQDNFLVFQIYTD